MNSQMIRRFGLALLVIGIGLTVSPALRAQDGAKLFDAKKCASCHGVDGNANTPAGKALKTRDFHLPDVQAESDADLAAVISKGKNKMPAYEKQLKPAEIQALVTYVRTLMKK